MILILIITAIVVAFISYLIIKDPTIVHKSISFSYYEDRETAVVWGSFAGVMGVTLAFGFPSILTLIAGICLILVPIAGNYEKKPINYIHYTLALGFYFCMLYYSLSLYLVIPYILLIIVTDIFKKYIKLSVFMIEVIGIIVIIIDLLIKSNVF
jgi:hypothetical protein